MTVYRQKTDTAVCRQTSVSDTGCGWEAENPNIYESNGEVAIPSAVQRAWSE